MYVPSAQCPVTMPTVSPAPYSGVSGLRRGLGCAGPNCRCGGSCGMGRHRGMGLFDSMDFTTWGIGEWGVIGVGAYLILSLAGDVRTGGTAVKKYQRRRRRAKMGSV